MRILITKPDALGDQIIVAGFIQQLNKQLPEAQIFWQVRSGMEVIWTLLEDTQLIYLEFSHYVEEEAKQIFAADSSKIHIIPYDLNPLDHWNEETWPRIWWWKDMLSAVKWDIVISPSMNHNWFSGLTLRFSEAGKRIGFSKNASWQPLEDSIAETTKALSPSVNIEVASDLAASEYEKIGELFEAITCQSFECEAITLRHRFEWTPKPKQALIFPGVGHQKERAWPIEKWKEISDYLEAKGWESIWIEGPQDAATFEIANEPIPKLRFETNQLHEIALLMSNSSLVLCNDTSYAHIAAAIGVPTVSIFGCGQGGRFFPMRGKVKPVQGRTIEEHCQWHNFIDIWASIREIPTEVVKQAIDDALEKQDFQPVYHDIGLSDTKASETELRRKIFDHHLEMNWENWTRLQLLRESEIKMQELLEKLEGNRQE